jgi:catechol 2,3-dioxygenase-like lactoylglutathione lyase family enzyme
MKENPKLFAGGRNIALKIPAHEYDDMVHFYREVLGLKQLRDQLPSTAFEFGANLLWLDRVETMTQAEIWLELRTPDTAEAARHLAGSNVARCDAVEKLPDGFDGFWISGPGKDRAPGPRPQGRHLNETLRTSSISGA